MIKKIIAFTLTVLLLLSAMAIPASAAKKIPTQLYVGEKHKSSDNIISILDREGQVIVHSINDDESYYTLTYDVYREVYTLTFYNNYKFSEPVFDGTNYYGIYCNGDLEIVIRGDEFTSDTGSASFDLSRHPETGEPINNAFGIYVKGKLTITNGYDKDPVNKYSTLIVSGDKRKSSDITDSIGIWADTILINEVSVVANGGFAGVYAKNMIAVVDAELYANRAADMFSTEINPKTNKPYPLFAYGIYTNLFIHASDRNSPSMSKVSVGGDIYVKSYVMKKNEYNNPLNESLYTNFDINLVVYLKDFLLSSAVKDPGTPSYKRGESFKVIEREIPEYIYLAQTIVSDNNGRAKWPTPRVSFNGMKATVVDGDGIVGIGIYLDCGDANVEFDYDEVNCYRTIFQKIWDFIAYYLLFGWVFGKI